MGNCLSDPSSDAKPKSSLAGAQRLGSPPTSPKPVSAPPKSNIHTLASSASPPQQASIARKHNLTGGQNTLGDGFEDPVRVKGEGGGGAREARLRAAEERAAKVSHIFVQDGLQLSSTSPVALSDASVASEETALLPRLAFLVLTPPPPHPELNPRRLKR